MRDRLIELLIKSGVTWNSCGVADYLIENGVIALPYKVGTRVYRIIPDHSVTWPNPPEYKIIWDTLKLNDIYTFGKTVFLSKEEAEKALAEVANGTR